MQCLFTLAPSASTGITQLLRYYGPLRHPRAPGLSLAGVRLIIPDHALGLPVLRALSLCTCRRHYPGAAAGRLPRSSHPAVSAFPERVVGSACALSFSRLARRSLALRPAHSRGHQFVTRYPKASDISSPQCRPQTLRLDPIRRGHYGQAQSPSRAIRLIKCISLQTQSHDSPARRRRMGRTAPKPSQRARVMGFARLNPSYGGRSCRMSPAGVGNF